MMCYLGMTFCNAKCTYFDCPKKLTEDVIKGAKNWWGKDGAPISVSDFSESCPLFVPESKFSVGVRDGCS